MGRKQGYIPMNWQETFLTVSNLRCFVVNILVVPPPLKGNKAEERFC